MSALSLERYRRQLSACCGPIVTKPNPLTAIERRQLEPPDPLEVIEDDYQQHFNNWSKPAEAE